MPSQEFEQFKKMIGEKQIEYVASATTEITALRETMRHVQMMLFHARKLYQDDDAKFRTDESINASFAQIVEWAQSTIRDTEMEIQTRQYRVQQMIDFILTNGYND